MPAVYDAARAPCPFHLSLPRPSGCLRDCRKIRQQSAEGGGGGNWSAAAWLDEVVPLRVELVARDVERVELGFCDADLGGVGALVEAGVDLQAGAGRCCGDEVDDRLQGDQRLASPVHRDEREQAVLDLVPLRGAGREVAYLDLEPGLLDELLQLHLPQAGAVAV